MEVNTEQYPDTIGLDVGDRTNQLYRLGPEGEVVEEARITTTKPALGRRFREMAPARVVLEVGPHSPWISRLLTAAGHEVIVATPRKLRLIFENDQKSDRADAE